MTPEQAEATYGKQVNGTRAASTSSSSLLNSRVWSLVEDQELQSRLVDSLFLETLERVFGHKQFRSFQREVVLSVLARRDTFVLMPTGGGKSLCFQLYGACLV